MTRPVQLSALPPEDQPAAAAFLRRNGGLQGPVSGQGTRDPGRMWCGHPVTAIVVDEDGIAVCGECSR